MTSNETARTMIGYLLVRGGVHQAAYGLALQKLTGVDMTKMLLLPNIDNEEFEHTRPWQSKGEHAKLYTFSPQDYGQTGRKGANSPRTSVRPSSTPRSKPLGLGGIWSGNATWADDAPLEVVRGHPAGGKAPEGTPNPAGFAPQYASEEVFEIAAKLAKKV